MPVYDEKCIKAKVKEFTSVINTNLFDDKLPKKGGYHICIACISINSVMKMEKSIIHKFI